MLDLIIAAAHDNGAAADTIIARWFKERRYAGSKDRRAVRELVYRAIRTFADPPPSGRAAFATLADDDANMMALFDGSTHGPQPLPNVEIRAKATVLPRWLVGTRPEWLNEAEAAAMLERAPLDLRVNRARANRDAMLEQFEGSGAIADLPDAIRLDDHPALEDHPAWQNGLVEVQDAGSQWITTICAPQPDSVVVDLCAGAGGKTLALAAALGGSGRIVACDTDRRRLGLLAPRAARAGATGIETRLLDPQREIAALGDLIGQADLVLVDAPCSGSGTWRRNPESRWRSTTARRAKLTALQAHVLDIAEQLVKPGGTLVYAVCSILDPEGADQIAAFHNRHGSWSVRHADVPVGRRRGAGLLLTPKHDSTDGFFIATLAKPC